jgi:hypothetical protein
MYRRVFAALGVVSAVLALTGSAATASRPNLPEGSTVWIAPMAGFDTFLRTAIKAVDLPVVFVRTRAEADYELSGVTVEEPQVLEENVTEFRTTRQNTSVRITKIDSGETMFKHSVRTIVRTPIGSARLVYWATRPPTPSRILATGKDTAARRCVEVLQQALNQKP